MADDRSLKDVVRFLDPSGDITDADIAALTQKLKFTEVLDVITYVSSDNLEKAREILSKYDERFTVAREAMVARPIGGGVGSKFGKFQKPKPIGPTGNTSTSTVTSVGSKGPGNQQDDQQEQDLDQLLTDPNTRNKPEVRQIANLLQRMNK